MARLQSKFQTKMYRSTKILISDGQSTLIHKSGYCFGIQWKIGKTMTWIGKVKVKVTCNGYSSIHLIKVYMHARYQVISHYLEQT